jgi:ribonuclease HI
VRTDGTLELSEYLGHATNNIAELTAILRGIDEGGSEAARLVVHTDSQYAIGVLSKGWRAKANTELVEKIRARIRSRGNVAFVYVPGHSGVPLNERCDELARLAIQTRANAKKVVPGARSID